MQQFAPADGPASADGSLTRTEEYRARYRAEKVPNGYSGPGHVAVTAASVLLPTGYGLLRLRDVQPLQWLTVPAMLVFGSLFVWALHKHVLHRPVPGLRFAYVLHTLQHHRFFTYEHNEPAGRRDFHIMLFPIHFGPILAVITTALGHVVVGAADANVGALIGIMSVLYYGLYELVHFASHLPERSPVLRLPLLRPLREHHRLHHDPRLMTRRNFNVVMPLFDWLFATLVRVSPH